MKMEKPLTLYQQVELHSNDPYNVKEVNRLIILIKKSKDQTRVSDYKYQLFICLSKVILKAVNNFFSICKKHGVPEEKVMHEDEDIVIECFLVLENCMNKVNLKYLKMFYFYFNSGLNRAMFRLYKRNYEKYANTVVNTDDNEKYIMDRIKQNHHFDLTSIDLKGFTALEMEIITHKLNNVKLKDFLKDHDLPANQYYVMWESIQQRVFDLYKNPDTNKLDY